MDDSVDWEKLILELGPALYRHFCVTFEAATADDLVQETIVRLVAKVRAGQFDARKGSMRMYAYGIAHFVKLEKSREPRHEPLEGDLRADQHHDRLEDVQQRQRLRAAISTLNEIQQRVIGLYLDEELSLREIAELLDLPEGTIKSHIHRAKEALKQALTSEQEKMS